MHIKSCVLVSKTGKLIGWLIVIMKLLKFEHLEWQERRLWAEI